MSAAIMLNGGLSLRRALQMVGMSRGSYYYQPKSERSGREKFRDPTVLERIRGMALMKPMYGTRMMAARLSRELGRPVNRKLVQHAFRVMGWTMPRMTKRQMLGAKDRATRPTEINQLWQSDLTYIWCGSDGWCYLFSVIDAFSREWVAYVFDPLARKDNAIQSVVKALQRHPDAAGMVTLRVDNGPQYASDAFRGSMRALGIELEYIAYRTPEQNPNIESFHGRLKREYVWPYDFNSYQEADAAIAEAFLDYNQRRPHSSLGYMSPYDFLSRLGAMVSRD
jgi:putative transposase